MSVFNAYMTLSGAVDATVTRDERMARRTSYRIGGPAALFVAAHSYPALVRTIQVLAAEGVDWVILGKGSNLLVSDKGYDGCVIVLDGEFSRTSLGEDGTLTAGAGALLSKVVNEALKAGLSGLEPCVGIPGTVGGALSMNAGTRREWIGSVVRDVVVLRVRERQPLARRPPQLAVERAGHETRLIELLAVAHQTVARKLQLSRIGKLCPLRDGNSRLHDTLALEQAVRPLLVQLIQRRIDLAAHGVRRHAQFAAHACIPGSPCRGIQRRDPVQRNIRAARQALRRRDADAHAGKRPGATANEHGIDFVHRYARLRQDAIERIHEFLIGVAAAHVVASCEQLHAPARGIAVCEAREGAREHVR